MDMDYLAAHPFYFKAEGLRVMLTACSGGAHPVLHIDGSGSMPQDGQHLPSLDSALSQCVQAAYVFTAVNHPDAWYFLEYLVAYRRLMAQHDG